MILNKKGKILLFVIPSLILMGIGTACKPQPFQSEKWNIDIDAKDCNLTINHQECGPILTQAELSLIKPEGVLRLSDWTVKRTRDMLNIICGDPEKITWTFSFSPNKITILCPVEGGILSGKAPAGKNRIPARTEDQDNGILYTSLGFVSAAGINCLFDRQTDTIIKFPKTGTLKRAPENVEQMDVSFPLENETVIELQPDYYKQVLGLKYYAPRATRFESAPVAWSSWYCYYMGLTEGDVINEVDALSRFLAPYGLEFIQIDACYTRGEKANYLQWNKEAFPNGGKWLFHSILSKGLKPALWINVYGSNYASPECADKYPENFYLRDENGSLSGACCTADDTVVRLDYSNPDVIEKHLKPMFRTLVDEWGLLYIKDAGWGTWIDYFDKNKEQAFDPNRTGRDIYVEVQKTLREILGPGVYIGGCAMHEVGLCFGIFDGSRTGGDDKAVWHPEKEDGMSMQTYFHSLFGANYLNNITWQCDPDAAMVRDPLTLEEGRNIVTAVALTGQVYMASDFMGRLPQEKLDLYRKTMPSTPIVPIDLYPYKIKTNKKDGLVWSCPQVYEFPRAIDLKVDGPAGTYDVVSVFNWENSPQEKTITLSEDLGLDRNTLYLAFDFWNQKREAVTENSVTAEIPAHGTRVFVIHALRDEPFVVATSRHITGTVSLKEIFWSPEENILRGTSEVVPDAPYSLFVYLPSNKTVENVSANTEVLFQRTFKGVLEVGFSGKLPADGTMLEWKIDLKEN
ncbi:MAG: hypothetical protein JXB26_02180 [Candidatus Aminicenantes bacterium]|nr:hypothetical protein [Candidatus Aminicenantes bacterium]